MQTRRKFRMEILIDNPLATMSGPYFLVLYGFIIFFAVIILGLVKSQFDRTDRFAVPSIPPNLDPYEIAYLRGGINEVARSVIFSLTQKGYVEIDNSAASPVIKKSPNPPTSNRLSPIEQRTLDWVGSVRQPSEVFNSYGLINELESYENDYRARLEKQQMLTSEQDRAILKPVKWSVYFLILSLGGYRLLSSIAHGYYNIIFLIIFIVAGLLIARAVAKLPRLTKIGKAYLDRLQTAFDNLKYTSQAAYIPSNEPKVAPQTTFAGVDPLLLSVGVFGSGILVGTVFDSHNQAFQRGQYNQPVNGSSCGSACGSSCSSTDSSGSSCSGGSSCSSGSSCGSGCGGGCGGGGCGS
jgi:uncharacterized protein (TIGR04222 family)